MRPLPLVLIVLVASTALPSPTRAQPAAGERQATHAASEDDSSAETSRRDLFFDPDDGALDLSGFLATRKGFLPVGGLITEPAVGYGATVGLMFLRDSIKDRAEQVRQDPHRGRGHLVPPSVTWAGGFATQNGSWGGGLTHLGIFKEDRYRYRGTVFYAGMNLDFYGAGGDLQLPLDSVSYTLDGFSVLQQVERRLGDSNFFLGANFRFSSFDTKLDLGDPPEWFPALEKTIKASGVGVVARYDSRSSIFTPDSGISATAQAVFYEEALGGDRTFRKGRARLRGWVPVHPSWVLGMRVDADLSGGDTPFYMLPSVDLRGVPSNRYQGKNAVSVEAELRWDFTRRWSLVGFLGSGWAGGDGAGDALFEVGHAAGGAGFRYLISRVFRIRTGMDFAWSEEDFAFYFTTGTAWGER